MCLKAFRCPSNMTCHRAAHFPSQVSCCVVPCPANVLSSCPAHTFSCPLSVGGGCCPIGLYCHQSMCLEYEYKTLRAYTPLTITTLTPMEHVDFYSITPTSQITEPSAPSDNHATAEAGHPTCAWPNCQPGTPGLKVIELPISDRVLGTPTATSAKMAEMAYISGAGIFREIPRKRGRLIPVGMESAAVAGAMIMLQPVEVSRIIVTLLPVV